MIETNRAQVAEYGLEKGLLDEPGWGQVRRIGKRAKLLCRLANQAKLKSYRTARRYKYGYEVPNNHADAMAIDEMNHNTRWADAEKSEIGQLMNFDSFEDMGKGVPPPEGYKKIRCHMVYDVRHDGSAKARFVANGNMTSVPLESVYSSVVSLRGVRLVAFIAELNGMELWGTDITLAYIQSYTKEKCYFIAGAEFGELEGHTLVIRKALYGMRSSGARFHDYLYDVLKASGFVPSRAEPDIWMRDMGDHYEYLAVYVDDILIASKNPQAIIDLLKAKPHSFMLKHAGPVERFLGMVFFRDEDGNLCWSPREYIDRMVDAFEHTFGHKPKQNVSSPLEKNDHPELDMTELLDMDGVNKYQSLIGALQWSISLGRFDVMTAVMTLSSFRVAPRQGHMDRIKRVYAYLMRFRDAVIRIRTEKPDYSDLPDPEYDWARTVYGEIKEEVPADAPKPLGKAVIHTCYVDANLLHCLVTGRSVTGVLHFWNQTPGEWYSKKQATVETATYGSEFVAARTAVDQIEDIRQTFRYLGVPIEGKSYLFGDNSSVVTSGTVPQSALKKRHSILCYHRVREAVASAMMVFNHMPGEHNPADIVSKHWGYQQVWSTLRLILFWDGKYKHKADS